MRQRLPVLPATAFFTCLFLALSAHASEDVERVQKKPFEIAGKLDSRTRTVDGEKVVGWFVRVGRSEYQMSAEVSQNDLRKLRRKYVTLRGEGEGSPADAQERMVAGTVTLEVQQPGVEGVVRVVTGAKKKAYVLETKSGRYGIAAKDARRFKAFVDLNVTAQAFRVTDGAHFALEKVTKVVRKLLEGERDPKNGEEALAASWLGTLTATKVPKGIPGVKPGDFSIGWTSSRELESTKGRLMRSYDVVGVRVRKFSRKKRTATIELAYSFGQGSYAVMLEGSFAADWKSIRGDWKSGFLGSGTFVVKLVPVPKAK